MAQRLKRRQVAKRDGLNQNVADRGGFHRSGQNRPARCTGGELVQQAALAPATDNVNF